ncbi:hypothetical protein [Streptomyces sp. NPDC059753]|uniref:hypothetical protein n=1 Tax=Streptomyces sp. NPDC059753 TaxID=3346933 RepID=UPI0036476B25
MRRENRRLREDVDIRKRATLASFDSYARLRGSRDSMFQASCSTQQQEQRAFGNLEQAIARLRTVFGG